MVVIQRTCGAAPFCADGVFSFDAAAAAASSSSSSVAVFSRGGSGWRSGKVKVRLVHKQEQSQRRRTFAVYERGHPFD